MCAISSSSPSPSIGDRSPIAIRAIPPCHAACCQNGTEYPRRPSTRTART